MTTPNRTTRVTRQFLRTGGMACAALIGVGALTGCADPLLSPNEPRSQYSRYDLVRGRFAPQYVEDEFGRREPNLRGRLILPD